MHNTSPPISLYIHFPWCIQKCPYCDFNSHKAHANNDHAFYIKQLIQDFKTHHQHHQLNRPVKSIFLGGGTPSLFSAGHIDYLLSALSQITTFLPDIEITLEANPGTIERDCFKAYKKAGINRVSLGVQSFDNQHLRHLGRIHDCKATFEAIDDLHQSGIHNFNLDIMHGLPDQSVDQAVSDINTAIDCHPAHISWYQLTLEPGTVFYYKQPELPGEQTLETIEIEGKKRLNDAGFKQYEISAYASHTSLRCIHNLNYWQFGDYIGIGAGAHSKITDQATGVIKRLWKHKQPRAYQQAQHNFVEGQSILSDSDKIYEFMLNALRLNEGFSPELFESHTHLAMERVQPLLKQAGEKGLLNLDLKQIKATELGYQFLNDTINCFA